MEEAQSPDASVGRYAGNIIKDQISQTALAGIQGPLNAITDPYRYGNTYFQQQAGSIIPNFIKDISKSIDPYMREVNTPIDAIQSGIPLLRNQMVTKRDVLGNIIPQEPTGLGAMFDLFNSKTPVQGNPVIDELETAE